MFKTKGINLIEPYKGYWQTVSELKSKGFKYTNCSDWGFKGCSNKQEHLKNEIDSLTPQDISSILSEKAAQDSKATQQEGLAYKTGRFVGKVAPFVGVGGGSKAGLAVGGGLAGGSELMEDSSVGKRLGSAVVH